MKGSIIDVALEILCSRRNGAKVAHGGGRNFGMPHGSVDGRRSCGGGNGWTSQAVLTGELGRKSVHWIYGALVQCLAVGSCRHTAPDKRSTSGWAVGCMLCSNQTL